MSWQQLATIQEENRREQELERARPLVDCPLCATRLEAGLHGRLHCPMGDWIEPG